MLWAFISINFIITKHIKFFLRDFLNCRDLGLWVALKCKEEESEQGQRAGRRVNWWDLRM